MPAPSTTFTVFVCATLLSLYGRAVWEGVWPFLSDVVGDASHRLGSGEGLEVVVSAWRTVCSPQCCLRGADVARLLSSPPLW